MFYDVCQPKATNTNEPLGTLNDLRASDRPVPTPLTAAPAPPRVALHGIAKRFGDTTVLEGIDLDLRGGSVTALAGENGAGKSTLLKLIAGIHRPDAGTIAIAGRLRDVSSPRAALDAGISMIHQELTPLRELPVYENLFLGSELGRAGFVNGRAMIRRARDLLGELELDVDPRTLARDLTTAQLQLVEIVKAVAVRSVSVVLMDEPTSSLNLEETRRLYALVARLKARGIAIAFTTHKMEELYAMADDVCILRDGRLVAREAAEALDEHRLIRSMVGRDLDAFYDTADQRRPPRSETPLLSLRAFSRRGDFRNVSLDVARGEIVGLAGLLGSGRGELLEAVFGLRRPDGGTLALGGETVHLRSPRHAMARGVAFVGEDRRRSGIIPQLGVVENLTLRALARFSTSGFLRKRRERTAASDVAKDLDIRARSLDQRVGTLSGGNQQKTVIGKWLLARPRPRLYLLVEPTRGIDVGAKAQIYALLRRLAADGAAIIFVSGELPELLNLSDRIVVMRAGAIVGDLDREAFSQEAVMTLAAGTDAA